MIEANQQDVLVELARDYLQEKRRKRRWSIFFKLLLVAWLALLIFAIFASDLAGESQEPHTALINIKGPIFEGVAASADRVAKGLRKAFKDPRTKAVLLRINSPGGSPVQASYIYKEIRRLKKENDKIKVYAVCVDMCASAAYYIAAAADSIYADPSSIVGSIGVVYNGFGFTGTMDKLGIDRRLVTAGKNKGFMDPFSPIKPEQEVHLQNMLDDVHQQFINAVIEGRSNRLQQNPIIFSGLFWSGDKAKQLGLIDGFGSAGSVAREIIKVERIKDFTVKPEYLARLLKQMSSDFGSYVFPAQAELKHRGLVSKVNV